VAFPELPRATVDGRLIVLTEETTALRQLATEHGLACGIGEDADPVGVPTSVREAVAALDLSVRRGRPVDARELATLDALLDQLPADRLRPFVGQLLAPLVAHDRTTGSELAATLRAYLDGGAAVVPVARTLFMHPNTLRHRLRRIADLTGRSPFDLRDRIAFSIALRVADRSTTAARTDGDQPPV
jgi:sugar diacid utilization regulator